MNGGSPEGLKIMMELTASPDTTLAYEVMLRAVENLPQTEKFKRLKKSLETLDAELKTVNKKKHASIAEKAKIYQAIAPVAEAMQALKDSLDPETRQSISVYLAKVYKFWRTISEKPTVPHVE